MNSTVATQIATHPGKNPVRGYGIALIIYSLIAWIASFTLVLERLELFKDAGHKASCDFGLFFSCTGVMQTEQAALLGFPNPILGIVGFAITGVIGLVLALLPKPILSAAGTAAVDPAKRLRRVLVGLATVGALIAMALVGFFWYTSVMNIMILCPWCMVVWAMVIPFFFHTMAVAAREFLGIKWLSSWWWLGALVAYLFVIGSILVQFSEYIF